MIFNHGMTIWILALVLLASLAGLGYRQGAIRVAFSLLGILVAALLAVPIGHLFQSLLPHLGVGNPVLVWAIAPVLGFALVSALFKAAAFPVHRKVEVYYKYQAGDLRLALWERMNQRLGLCLGLVNGTMYFVLVTFFIFNLSYWTTQVAASEKQTALIKLVNRMGHDLQTTGIAKAACGVGTLPESYYQLADLSGLLVQNPQVGPRLADYPALTSLWEQPDMQPLIQDTTLTNALSGEATLGDVMNAGSVQDFLRNKELSGQVLGIVLTNLDDLTTYLQTGKSAKFDGEKIIGHWEFNAGVTVAWLRQSRPKMTATEMRAVRAFWAQAYSQTRVLVTGDNKIFIKKLPKFKTEAGQQPDLNDWKGDWSRNDNGYDLHITSNNEDKYLTATIEGLRMSVRDGKSLLVFDRAD
jgi:uncharacterized membrane protein required for colicin V production